MTELFNGRIFTINSSTGTSLWAIIQYEKKREGANMLYRFNYKVYISNGSGTPNPYGSYQNNLRATFTLNGNSVWTKDTKSSSTGWSFEYTTDWFTVSNKTSGTTPFKFTIKDTQNSSWCNYTSGTFSLGVDPAGSDIGAVANFNIGNAITVPITKYASMYDVLVVKIGSTAIKTINNASSPTTITFTSSELDTIYGLTTEVQSIEFTFELTTYEDSSKATVVGVSKTTTARGYIVGSDPVINTITAIDINPQTSALTENSSTSSKIVRYKSNVKVSVSVSPVNQATIKSITINGKTATLSSGYYVATFNSVNTNSFDVKVIDSRDFPTNKNLTISSSNYIQYVDLTLNANVYRNQPTDGKLVIDYSGNYFNGSFGSTSNSLTVQYRYIEKGGSWDNVNWNTLIPIISGNTYKGNLIIEGFDYQKQYVFQIRASDKLSLLDPTVVNVTKGEPIINWDETMFNVNGLLKRKNIDIDTLYAKGESWSGTSIDEFKTYVVNNARIGSTIYYLNLNGSISCAILLKANSLYLSFVWFSYGVDAIQYKYFNNTWVINSFSEKYADVIYTGTLKGGESTILSNVKRFIDVYAVVHFSNISNGIIKYTIDTTLYDKIAGSGIINGFDTTGGLEYYVSESLYDKTTGEFEHKSIGFFNLANSTWSSRNNNGQYYVYRIETHD